MTRQSWYAYQPDTDGLVGPLAQDQIEEMVRKGRLQLDDFVWGSHLSAERWFRICALPEFKHLLREYPSVAPPRKLSAGRKQESKIVADLNEEGEYGRENLFRRYPRAPLEVELLVHDNQALFRGRTVNISEKGASLFLVDHQSLSRGDEVVVTFRCPATGLGTFSAPSVVLRELEYGSERCWGIFFLRLNPNIRRLIAEHVFNSLSRDAV